MSKKESNCTRRQIFKSGIAIAAFPLVGSLSGLSRDVLADEALKLEESDATAQSFGYTVDASSVDVTKFPKRAGADGASQTCNSCQLFQAEAGAEWGPCSIFQGKLVKADGWCNAWVKKA